VVGNSVPCLSSRCEVLAKQTSSRALSRMPACLNEGRRNINSIHTQTQIIALPGPPAPAGASRPALSQGRAAAGTDGVCTVLAPMHWREWLAVVVGHSRHGGMRQALSHVLPPPAIPVRVWVHRARVRTCVCVCVCVDV